MSAVFKSMGFLKRGEWRKWCKQAKRLIKDSCDVVNLFKNWPLVVVIKSRFWLRPEESGTSSDSEQNSGIWTVRVTVLWREAVMVMVWVKWLTYATKDRSSIWTASPIVLAGVSCRNRILTGICNLALVYPVRQISLSSIAGAPYINIICQILGNYRHDKEEPTTKHLQITGARFTTTPLPATAQRYLEGHESTATPQHSQYAFNENTTPKTQL